MEDGASDADSVEFLCVTHEAHPGQIWSAEKVNAVVANRPLIDAEIRNYQTKHPNWKDQNISVVVEEITNIVKEKHKRLVKHVVRNIVWTVLASAQSGSCTEDSKKEEHEEKIVKALSDGV